MQDETQNPVATDGAAQEPNNAPDPGVAADPGGSEGFGQELSGEGPAATPTEQGGSAFDLAASMVAEEVSFDPNGMAEGIWAAADVWQDTAEGLAADADAAFQDVGEAVEDIVDDIPSSPFWPTGPDPEVAPDLFDAGDAGPLGATPPETAEQEEGEPAFFTPPGEDVGTTPSPATAEGEEEEPIYNPLFTTPWEDLGVPSPGRVEEEEEENIFTVPMADLGMPSGTAEEESILDPLFTAPPWEEQEGGEPIFTPPWEDAGAPFPGTVEKREEEEEDEDVFTALLQSMNEDPLGAVEEEPIFAAPWEDDSTAPEADPSIFPVGWDDALDTTSEGQEDGPNGVAEGIWAAADAWQDTAEGLIEDAGAAFEDVGEAVEDIVDDIF